MVRQGRLEWSMLADFVVLGFCEGERLMVLLEAKG